MAQRYDPTVTREAVATDNNGAMPQRRETTTTRRDGWAEYHSASLERARDVHVVIYDSQLAAEEIDSEAWFDNPRRSTPSANAKHAVMFHYKPSRAEDALVDVEAGIVGQPVAPTQSLILDP
jgi:hypothetical protein